MNNIDKCRFLYNHLKFNEDRKQRWLEYAKNIGVHSYCYSTTLSIVDDILTYLNKIEQSDLIAKAITNSFNSFSEDTRNGLFLYIEKGNKAKEDIMQLLQVRSERTLYRRLDWLSQYVVNKFVKEISNSKLVFNFKDIDENS